MKPLKGLSGNLSQGLRSFGLKWFGEGRLQDAERRDRRYVFLAGYGLLLDGAIKVFGLRRVLGVIFGIVFLGVVVALKTLGAVTSRRY